MAAVCDLYTTPALVRYGHQFGSIISTWLNGTVRETIFPSPTIVRIVNRHTDLQKACPTDSPAQPAARWQDAARDTVLCCPRRHLKWENTLAWVVHCTFLSHMSCRKTKLHTQSYVYLCILHSAHLVSRWPNPDRILPKLPAPHKNCTGLLQTIGNCWQASEYAQLICSSSVRLCADIHTKLALSLPSEYLTITATL